MTNKEILDRLFNSDNNGKEVNECLGEWDTTEPFPIADVKRYIKLNEWSREDFNTHIELIMGKVMPLWFFKVYLSMSEFVKSAHPELSNEQETFARLMGYPVKTESEKAFCYYDYAIHYYTEKEESC